MINAKTTPKYIRTQAVCSSFSISRMTLWRLTRDCADFPRPVKMAGQNLWPVAEVEAWFEGRRG